MTLIAAVRQFMLKCPHLNEFSKGINIDYLSDDTTSYSIEETPCNPIVKRYIDGSSIRQFEFIFASRESYGQEVLQNIENSSFYEDFSDWIEEQDKIMNYPKLDNSIEVQKIECTSTGYAFQTEVDQARYQIQLRLKYYKPSK